ncbi:MAG: hypothetical protein ACOCSK_01075 [Rhodothermales bacterium]
MTIEEVHRRFHTLRPNRPADFEEMAEAVFRFQVAHNPVYARFAAGQKSFDGWLDAPPLPIEAFRLAPVATGDAHKAEAVFESSGTGGSVRSRHFVESLEVYDRSALSHFQTVFGDGQLVIVGHLPAYSERGERSSLVYMVRRLIDRFGGSGSGFFLEDFSVLDRAAGVSQSARSTIILFGAAFGLLDIVDRGAASVLPPDTIVIETGGMKTHRRAIGRTELHERLATGFGLDRRQIFSEYGMTELLSQCYTRGNVVFHPPPWLRFEVVHPDDPARILPEGEPGVLRVFDIANLFSVSAILTQDLAVRRGSGFEVLGRVGGAELRGCNFLIESNA